MSGEQTTSGRFLGPGYYGEQDENGVDLSVIRENLKLTPLERIRRADAARRQALLPLEYGRRSRENRDGAKNSADLACPPPFTPVG